MRKTEWVWSKDAMCWIWQPVYGTPPTAYCLGDRNIHASYGLDSYGVLWRGSTRENYHGYNFHIDLGKAILWVRRANETELGHTLWRGGSRNRDTYEIQT